MNGIHICFATDESYAPYCGVAIASIIKSKDIDDRLYIYILNQKLKIESKRKLTALSVANECEIHVIDIAVDQLALLKDAPIAEGLHLTIETYFRLLIPKIFIGIDRVLYLDCDILVRGSLAELFFMDMQGKLLAMAESRYWNVKNDFNAGVMLVDCKQWREDNVENLLFQAMKGHKTKLMHDQDLINCVLNDRIFALSHKWNRYVDEYLDNVSVKENDVILHFLTEIKPWHGVYQNALVDEYFVYLNQLTWGIEDKRERNKEIDPRQYYKNLQSLRYLKDIGMLSAENELILLPTCDSLNELIYAASDLGFCNARNVKLKDVPERSSNDMRVVVESDFNYETKIVLERLGYKSGEDYSFLCTITEGQIEREMVEAIEQQAMLKGQTMVIIYGTANWALKLTQVIGRFNIDIMFYADSSPEKWGQILYGKKIISPLKLTKMTHNSIPILIASSAFAEIKKKLVNLGIDKNRIITFEFMAGV